MGRKSRLKRTHRELRQQGLSQSSATLIFLDQHGQSVYRFFKEESHADSLASGEVWLSTLETCRKYEDPAQGDSEEAYETYNSGHVVGDSDNPSLVEIARRIGAYMGPGCSNVTISNSTRRTILPDAYVFCTTTDFSPNSLSETFGKYCVEINKPKLFFCAISENLEKSIAIKEAAAGNVIYKDRHYRSLESPPGPIGFVKPPDIYSNQKEFRFLWIPRNANGLSSFLLTCPQVSQLCRRIA